MGCTIDVKGGKLTFDVGGGTILSLVYLTIVDLLLLHFLAMGDVIHLMSL